MRITCALLWRAARFCAAGSLGVATYYVVLYSLTEYAGLWYPMSSVAAFCANTGLNFVLHKYWTFQSKSNTDVTRQLALYAATMVVSTLGLWVMVRFARLWYIHASLILLVVASTVTFFISGRIFRNERGSV